jgi:hypothetical protein
MPLQHRISRLADILEPQLTSPQPTSAHNLLALCKQSEREETIHETTPAQKIVRLYKQAQKLLAFINAQFGAEIQ